MKKVLSLCMCLFVSFGLCVGGSTIKADLKLYVFDCGLIKANDISSFGISNEDTDVRELFVPCYLIEHENGRLFWDAGLPPSAAGAGEIEVQPGVTMIYERSVIDQLADINVTLEDIDLVAFSHMHWDHTGAANLFVGSEMLIQAAEYEAAFNHAEDFPVFDKSLYGAMENAEKTILHGDYDVFGDGTVTIVSAPGHTPGHQVLLLNLVNTGFVLLSGDLYHFEVSRDMRATPDFNFDRDMTLAAMDKVEALIEETGATLWIEHVKAFADTLDKAPKYYD